VTFVLDASVVLSWHLDDEPNSYADTILARLASEPAVAPNIWPLEVANGLLIAERRGRLTTAGTSRVYQDLSDLPIAVQHVPLESAQTSVLALARDQRLSAYDAAYLELAMREGLPLATLDDGLRAAGGRVGVPLA